jgi:hypothetical protein
MSDREKLLQYEREKLNRIIEGALQQGMPVNKACDILRSEAVVAQSRRVDKLAVCVEREREAPSDK